MVASYGEGGVPLWSILLYIYAVVRVIVNLLTCMIIIYLISVDDQASKDFSLSCAGEDWILQQWSALQIPHPEFSLLSSQTLLDISGRVTVGQCHHVPHLQVLSTKVSVVTVEATRPSLHVKKSSF